MKISIPQAFAVENQFFAEADLKGAVLVDGANWPTLSQHTKYEDALFDVVALTEGALEHVCSTAEFRALTSLIALLIAGNAYIKDEGKGNLDGLKVAHDSFVRMYPAGGSSPFSVNGRVYKKGIELLELAVEDIQPETLYVSGCVTGFLRFQGTYPRGSKGILDLLDIISEEFEWSSRNDFHLIERCPTTSIKWYSDALTTVRELGLSFKYEKECLRILEVISNQTLLLKVKSSCEFISK